MWSMRRRVGGREGEVVNIKEFGSRIRVCYIVKLRLTDLI